MEIQDRLKCRAQALDDNSLIYGLFSVEHINGDYRAVIVEEYGVGNYIANEVHENTVEQCSGKKSVEDELMYEGDIFVVNETYPFYSEEGLHNYVAVLRYSTEYYLWHYTLHPISDRVRGDASGGSLECISPGHIYVLGNVTENPELLEVKSS